jgi:hypothetical protein
MFEKTSDFIRCSYNNKFTRNSYLALSGVAAIEVAKRVFDVQGLEVFTAPELISTGLAGLTLLLTGAGHSTRSAHSRCRDIFRAEGKVPSNIARAYHFNAGYCPKVGIEMAAKDANVEIPPPTTQDLIYHYLLNL